MQQPESMMLCVQVINYHEPANPRRPAKLLSIGAASSCSTIIRTLLSGINNLARSTATPKFKRSPV
jgi:hypothetical protein